MKTQVFKNAASHALQSPNHPITHKPRKSAIRNSVFKNQVRRVTTHSTESATNEFSDYALHPQIISNLKIDKGSIDNFMKKDDIQNLFEFDDDFDSNFIISKIDKIGIVGKRARHDLKKKEIEKKR